MVTTSQFSVVPGAIPVQIAVGSRSAAVTVRSYGGNVYIGDSSVSDTTGFLLQGTDALGTVDIPLGQGDSLYAFRAAIEGFPGFVTVLTTN